MDDFVTNRLLAYMDGLAFQLDSLLPWVKYLNTAERAELVADITQAWAQCRKTGEIQTLTEVLDDWEATALVLSDAHLTARLLAPQADDDYIPWGDVRANLPGETAP